MNNSCLACSRAAIPGLMVGIIVGEQLWAVIHRTELPNSLQPIPELVSCPKDQLVEVITMPRRLDYPTGRVFRRYESDFPEQAESLGFMSLSALAEYPGLYQAVLDAKAQLNNQPVVAQAKRFTTGANRSRHRRHKKT